MRIKLGDFRKFVSTWRRDYQLTFGTSSGERVLSDLARFCFATKTCAVPGDHDRTMMALGRNEVWQHISQYFNLSTEQLMELQKHAYTIVGDEDA